MITVFFETIEFRDILIKIGLFIFVTILFFISKNTYKHVLPLKSLKTTFIMYIFALVVILILPIILSSYADNYDYNYYSEYWNVTPLVYFFLLSIFYIRRMIKRK